MTIAANIGTQIIEGITVGTGDALFVLKLIAGTMAVLWISFIVGLALLARKYFDSQDDLIDAHYAQKPEATVEPEIRKAA